MCEDGSSWANAILKAVPSVMSTCSSQDRIRALALSYSLGMIMVEHDQQSYLEQLVTPPAAPPAEQQ